MQELANVLGRERVQLEFLLFKILELQHLLRSGDERFLRWASEEILRAGQHVRVTELTCARRVSLLARAAGVADDQATLAALTERAPEPWRTIFADHNEGFRQLVAEVETVNDLTCRLAEALGHSFAGVLKQAYRPAFGLLRSADIRVGEPMVLP